VPLAYRLPRAPHLRSQRGSCTRRQALELRAEWYRSACPPLLSPRPQEINTCAGERTSQDRLLSALDKPVDRRSIFIDMNATTRARNLSRGYRQQAGLLRALAHPTRLRILEILSLSGECCVCHLTAILRQRQPYVSQHLMVLRSHGLVEDRRDGVMVYYRLSDQRIRELIDLTRELLRSCGVEAHFPPVPDVPVPGCPCPECTARLP
jgi:DNA-binding transcriptional ArsR family regulator